MAGKEHQFEAVLDLVDAFLNGHAGHSMPLSCSGFHGKLAACILRKPAKYKPDAAQRHSTDQICFVSAARPWIAKNPALSAQSRGWCHYETRRRFIIILLRQRIFFHVRSAREDRPFYRRCQSLRDVPHPWLRHRLSQAARSLPEAGLPA